MATPATSSLVVWSKVEPFKRDDGTVAEFMWICPLGHFRSTGTELVKLVAQCWKCNMHIHLERRNKAFAKAPKHNALREARRSYDD